MDRNTELAERLTLAEAVEEKFLDDAYGHARKRGRPASSRVQKAGKKVVIPRSDRSLVTTRLTSRLRAVAPRNPDPRYSVESVVQALSSRDTTRYTNIAMLGLAVRCYSFGSNEYLASELVPELCNIIDLERVPDYVLDALVTTEGKGKEETPLEQRATKNAVSNELLRYLLFYWETMNPTVAVILTRDFSELSTGEEESLTLKSSTTLSEFWETLTESAGVEFEAVLTLQGRSLVVLRERGERFTLTYETETGLVTREHDPRERLSNIVVGARLLLDSLRRISLTDLGSVTGE